MIICSKQQKQLITRWEHINTKWDYLSQGKTQQPSPGLLVENLLKSVSSQIESQIDKIHSNKNIYNERLK